MQNTTTAAPPQPKRPFARLWGYINSHFFNKAFLLFLLVAVLAGALLLMVLSQNLITIKTEQSVDMSNQIVLSVDTYLSGKITSALSIHQRFIRDNANWRLLCAHLEGDADTDVLSFPGLRQSLSQTIYAVDSEIYGLYFASAATNGVLTLTSSTSGIDATFFEQAAIESSGTRRLLAAHDAGWPSNSFSFFVLNPIASPDSFAEEIGTLGLSFNAMNLGGVTRQYDSYIKGPVLVLDETGGLLYDSTAAYTLDESFPFAEIAALGTGNKTIGDTIYTSRYSSTGGYYVVNLIPLAEVRKDVDVVRRSITAVIVLVLVAALAITFVSSRRFSRRLARLTDTMELARGGQLTGLTATPASHDEIGAIHQEFVSVCQSLDTHIQKEYVYQLKQKEMEFYALQAQIDPHFLYNTLESVRMKLLLSGDNESSRMVRILSEMFRNIMKTDRVVIVRDELSYLRSYLELYKLRYGDKLSFSFIVDEDVYTFATIKHILQPIVENSLLHGLGDFEGEGHITVAARLEESDILFDIRDNGKGIDTARLTEIRAELASGKLFSDSVGIYNVNNRLRIVYGPAYQLEIDSHPGAGTGVSLRIKAMTKKELEEYVQGFDSGR